MTMTPVAMTIAGSDSSCGAGIQADLRMFAARGVYGATVITALTAQNPVEVTGVVGIAPEFVKAQAETVLQAFPIRAVKTGMLWSAETIDVVSDLIQTHSLKVIVDPVMIATSGAKLISDEAIDRYQHRLLPLATLATPNLDEASTLLGGQVIDAKNQEDAAKELYHRLRCPILLKGGHLKGDPIDLFFDGESLHRWTHPRLTNVNTHGSGCMLSAAITAEVAKGCTLVQAIERGLEAVHAALYHPVALTQSLTMACIEASSTDIS